MNDISGSLHPSIQHSSSENTSRNSFELEVTFDQLCSDEMAKLPDTLESELLKSKLAAIQNTAKNGWSMTEEANSTPPPTATKSPEVISRARAGSVIHEQQQQFPPKLEQKSAGLLASLVRPGSRRNSTSMEALSTLSKTEAKTPKVKAFLTKLLAPNKNASSKASNTPSPGRTSIDLSEPETPQLALVLDQGKKLFGSRETLANSCRNLVDVLSLSVPEGMSVQDFSNQLVAELAEFKKAYDQGQNPLPTVQGKQVPQKDVNALKNLAGQILVDKTWQGLFTDVIQRKEDAKEGRAFLSATVLQAMSMLKSESEIKQLSTYLMSECTTNAGIARVIEPAALKILLNDPRIALKPDLQNGIKTAAHTVMQEAVRRCQSNIVFLEAKASGKTDWKSDIQTWENTAKLIGDEFHDLDGVNKIAKQAGLKLVVEPKEHDDNQKVLAQILQIKHTVHQVISSHV